MDFDQFRYRGFIIKVIDGGGGFRAVVYDPMKKGQPIFDHYAISGYSKESDALEKCHEYVDNCILKEMEQYTFITMGLPL